MSKEYIAKLEQENAYLRRRLDVEDKSADLQPGYATGQMASGLNQQTVQLAPEEAIDFLFTFHDDPDKTPHYVEIRESAKAMAKIIVRHTPHGGPDRLTAINKLREAVMFANACVALSGRGI